MTHPVLCVSRRSSPSGELTPAAPGSITPVVADAVLRILDANLNRAREALRVVEDYARFAMDDLELCSELKQLRHDVADATSALAGKAILHRDTPGDVGTTAKVDGEMSRADVADVVVAAGKRLGEALRTIEEYLKTVDPAAAAKVEAGRYRFYEIERRVALTLRSTKSFEDVRLYVLITESACAGRSWLDVAREAIRGGADCLQLREKDMDGGELLRRAKQLVELCREQSVVSIVNDRVDVAIASDADGVHLGQSDLSVADARQLLGRDKYIGVSTHAIDDARRAVADGADYIGVGPVFRSGTKPREIDPGLPYAKQVAGEISIPAVAIAGITLENVDAVLQTGIRAVAVTAAICGAGDVEAAARAFRERIDRPRE